MITIYIAEETMNHCSLKWFETLFAAHYLCILVVTTLLFSTNKIMPVMIARIPKMTAEIATQPAQLIPTKINHIAKSKIPILNPCLISTVYQN